MYRAFPAAAQYQKDLAPLLDSKEMADAVWDVAVAVAIKVATRGKEAFSAKLLAELQNEAPTLFSFFHAVNRAVAHTPAAMLKNLGPAEEPTRDEPESIP